MLASYAPHRYHRMHPISTWDDSPGIHRSIGQNSVPKERRIRQKVLEIIHYMHGVLCRCSRTRRWWARSRACCAVLCQRLSGGVWDWSRRGASPRRRRNPVPGTPSGKCAPRPLYLRLCCCGFLCCPFGAVSLAVVSACPVACPPFLDCAGAPQ